MTYGLIEGENVIVMEHLKMNLAIYLSKGYKNLIERLPTFKGDGAELANSLPGRGEEGVKTGLLGTSEMGDKVGMAGVLELRE